ncbi:proton-coupled zinc antiporter SLC30A1-like [Artemia franciscana]|uniref:proton-coupled zinc antiporter SLC30A1-like n=1 Tax=Artemia franciscana TaxID=6661 RepID=UPI0032DA3985
MAKLGKKCRLITMFSLTMSFFLVELIVGYVTNSNTLVADAFHMLSDVASLVVAFLSIKMSPKPWAKNTFGWARAEVLGALINSVFLIALCFSILVESVKRFLEVEEVHDPELLLVVGTIGLLINVVGLFLFHDHGHSHGHGHGHSHLTQLAAIDNNENDETFIPPVGLSSHVHSHDASQMNMKGVFLHVLADALGSVVVIISALIIWLTEWEYKMYIDPALSVALVLLITCSSWPLLRDSSLILLQTVPTHIRVDDIEKKLLKEIDGVLAVHEFHVWQLAGDRIIASAHIRCRNLNDYMRIARDMKIFFHNEGIHSTTIQPEFTEAEVISDDSASEAESCQLYCPPANRSNGKDCAASTCCGSSLNKLIDNVSQPNQCRFRPVSQEERHDDVYISTLPL